MAYRGIEPSKYDTKRLVLAIFVTALTFLIFLIGMDIIGDYWIGSFASKMPGYHLEIFDTAEIEVFQDSRWYHQMALLCAFVAALVLSGLTAWSLLRWASRTRQPIS